VYAATMLAATVFEKQLSSSQSVAKFHAAHGMLPKQPCATMTWKVGMRRMRLVAARCSASVGRA
jgi:hypothetical protein